MFLSANCTHCGTSYGKGQGFESLSAFGQWTCEAETQHFLKKNDRKPQSINKTNSFVDRQNR